MLIVYLIINLFIRKAFVFAGNQNQPRNVAVLEGQKVSMSCRPRSPTSIISWYHEPAVNKSSTITPINIGSNITRQFTEFSFGGITPEVLQLNNTRLRHAGLFRCVTEGREFKAQLIVLESEPNCNYTANGSHLHFICTISFSGKWIPSMRWMEVMENDTESRTIADNKCSSSSEAAQSLGLNIDSMSIRPKTVIVFKLNFSNKLCERTKATANNTPSYEFTWKMSIEKIIRELFKVTVHPQKNSLTPDGHLTRTSASVPNSHFKWTEETTERVNSGESNKHLLLTVIVPATVSFTLFMIVTSIAIIRKLALSRSDPRRASVSNIRKPDANLDGNNRELCRESEIDSEEHYASIEPVNEQYTGADGTVYSKLNGSDEKNQMPKVPLSTNRQPKFNKSEYASIDHSLVPLPAPPR